VRIAVAILAVLFMLMLSNAVSASQFIIVVVCNGKPTIARVDLYKSGKCVYTDWTNEQGVLKITTLPADEYTVVINQEKAYKVDFNKTDVFVISIEDELIPTLPHITITEREVRYILVGVIVMSVLIGSFIILTRKGGG